MSNVPQFAICISNREYAASLELHKVYRVLTDSEAAVNGDLRIIDESGEDYLYPASYFIVIDLPQEAQQTLAHSFTNFATN